MKFIRDVYAHTRHEPVLSFEFFTPKTEEGERKLVEKTAPALARLGPSFFSVTYGAGGSTRQKTLAIAHAIQGRLGLPAMCHLTCVNATREQIRGVLDEALSLGLHNVLALRGDPPNGAEEFTKSAGGFEYASELVAFIRQLGGFSIGVAGFPTGHIECKEGKEVDWLRLRDKIQAGADFVLTQLFFSNEEYFEFREHLNGRLNVKVPLVPGIMPIVSVSQIQRITALSGATLPRELVQRLEAHADDEAATIAIGIEQATRQCEDLLKNGVSGLHFYCLNKVHSVREVIRNLGLSIPLSGEDPGPSS